MKSCGTHWGCYQRKQGIRRQGRGCEFGCLTVVWWSLSQAAARAVSVVVAAAVAVTVLLLLAAWVPASVSGWVVGRLVVVVLELVVVLEVLGCGLVFVPQHACLCPRECGVCCYACGAAWCCRRGGHWLLHCQLGVK